MMLNDRNISKNNNNNINLINNLNNISSIKINKSNDLNDKNNESNTSVNKHDSESKKNSKNIYLYNNGETSKKISLKGKSVINFLAKNIIDQNMFECILYCLYNINKLTNYILNNNENIQNFADSFTNNFIKIYQFLVKNKKDSNNISELEFGQNLIKNCPFYNFPKLINDLKFEDGNNIISKIINILQFELNKSNGKEENENIKYNYPQDIFFPEKDKIREYNNFIKECQENNNSIIFDLFYGITEVKIKCNKCNKLYYKYEMIDIIELSKEKIYKFHKENKINNIDNKINISIEDCINFYKNQEKQQEKILFKSPFCKECSNYSIFYDIIKYPEIFILYFYNNFEELKINICEKVKTVKDEYELISIIESKNKKENNKDNKYNAYFKIISNNKWILYEDDKMKDVDINVYIENICPIALFYQKNKK